MLHAYFLRKSTINPLSFAAFIYFALTAFVLPLLFAAEWFNSGLEVWRVPLKFSLSIAVFLIAMEYLLGFLPIEKFHRKKVDRLLLIFLSGSYILTFIQACRGTLPFMPPQTFFDQLIFHAMSMMLVLNGFLLSYLFLLFFLMKIPVPLTLLWGIRWGMLLFLFSSLGAGFLFNLSALTTMEEVDVSSWVTMQWHQIGGDLTAVHFWGLFALMFLPLTAWYIHKNRQEWRILFPVVWVFSVALICLLYSLYLTFVQLTVISMG